MAIQEYKCPCCGGAISFHAAAQKMKCSFCDTEFEMEALEAYDEVLKQDGEDNLNWEVTPNKQWEEGETDNLKIYVCKSCGGEIVSDATTAATSCPYCDNPVVMMEQFTGVLKPDYVIPFKLDKKAAKEVLNKQLKGKKLLAKNFKEENHIDEIKGIYVPFWLFDTDVQANIRYRATRNRFWSDSKYRYDETSFYTVVRGGNIGFERIPVDGSKKMDDTLMESLEPFNFNEAVDFQTAYLAGYLADKYDVDADDSIGRANERVRISTEEEFRRTVHGFTTVIPEHTNISLSNSVAKYALYPVWILNTTWGDKKYTFAINGQTGKFAGNLPVNKKALFGWLFGITGVVTVVLFLLQYLFWMI